MTSGSDGAVANSSKLVACIVMAVLACDPDQEVPAACLKNLGAIPVNAVESKSNMARAVSCMQATQRKAMQNVALDPVMIASLVQSVVGRDAGYIVTNIGVHVHGGRFALNISLP